MNSISWILLTWLVIISVCYLITGISNKKERKLHEIEKQVYSEERKILESVSDRYENRVKELTHHIGVCTVRNGLTEFGEVLDFDKCYDCVNLISFPTNDINTPIKYKCRIKKCAWKAVNFENTDSTTNKELDEILNLEKKIFYLCDEKACDPDRCKRNAECIYTTNIEHAKNFEGVGFGAYQEKGEVDD